MENIIKILSLPFKCKNRYALTKSQFVFALSFDMGLYAPSECERILQEGAKKKLLSIKGDVVRPSIALMVS